MIGRLWVSRAIYSGIPKFFPPLRNDIQVPGQRVQQQGFCVATTVWVLKNNGIHIRKCNLDRRLVEVHHGLGKAVDVHDIVSRRTVISNFSDIEIIDARLRPGTNCETLPVHVFDTIDPIYS